MENSSLSKNTRAFGLSLAVTSVINALLVVAKERSPAVQAGMKRLTGHHWITHSAGIIVLFFVMGWLLAKTNGGRGVTLTFQNLLRTLVGGVVLGALIIVGFYLFAD
jgi:hypothetical protein